VNRQEEIIIEEEQRRDRGFTLIELLIVIAILGILSTIVVLSVRGITDRGQSSACSSDEKTLEVAYEAAVANGVTFTPDTPANGTVPAVYSSDISATLVSGGYLHSSSANYTVTGDGTVSAVAAPAGKCA
jgi:general secretion pathway protein G